MMVFKFGGASVKDANAVKNVVDIIQNYKDESLVVIISAMDKTTNHLEKLLEKYLHERDAFPAYLKKIKDFHYGIIDELFDQDYSIVYDDIESQFLDLEFYFDFDSNKEQDETYLYDQVVSYGEVLSTKIVSHYLLYQGFKNKWIDARNMVITDREFKNASVDWETTTALLQRKLKHILKNFPIITQGFIGSTIDRHTTTLGREGSDFSAAIFAHALDAKAVKIWKDVPGILNADPKKFEDTVKFDELSYQEAIEMAYYGAKVLHPKTIKPLQNKQIPLEVRSFIEKDQKGTFIEEDVAVNKRIPIIISKENQALIRLSSRDFSFMEEHNLSKIFKSMSEHGTHLNVMKTSAISFSFATDDKKEALNGLINCLSDSFEVSYTAGLSLITVRYYNKKTIEKLTQNKKVLLEQVGENTIQLIVGSEA